jgi:Sulfotransferase domain
MTLRAVGAGLGRTGTHSLKLAFEQLLGGPCYHMLEVLGRPEQAAAWSGAAHGMEPDWTEFLRGNVATVDWPAASFWRELTASAPSAIVVLSVRDSEAWWKSASETIFSVLDRGAPPDDPGVRSQSSR